MKNIYFVIGVLSSLVFIHVHFGCVWKSEDERFADLCPAGEPLRKDVFMKAQRVMRSRGYALLWVDLYPEIEGRSSLYMVLCDPSLQVVATAKAHDLLGWIYQHPNLHAFWLSDEESMKTAAQRLSPFGGIINVNLMRPPDGWSHFRTREYGLLDNLTLSKDSILLQIRRSENCIVENTKDYQVNRRYYDSCYPKSEILRLPISSLCYSRSNTEAYYFCSIDEQCYLPETKENHIRQFKSELWEYLNRIRR